MRARVVLALAAVALLPKAIASDASSASEGDRTALAVTAAGAAALVAVTTSDAVGLADRFGGSSEPRTGAAYDADFLALRRCRFQHVDRSCVPDGWHPCRGTEMQDERVAAHLALMATFDSKNQAKAQMSTTVATIFGDDAWEARNEAEVIWTTRMFSSGAVSLVDTLDLAFDAYGANDGSMPFFDSMGGALEAAGLVQVKDDVLVDGWRLEAARASLEAQGYSDDSHAMRALAIENILVVWLNLALSDPVLKESIPCFLWAHCFWGAFGNVAPELFVELLDAFWAARAGDTLVLPAHANSDAGEVAAGALFVLEAAAAAVPVGSPAATLIADGIGRQRAADAFFSKPRTARVQRTGRTPQPRRILPDEESDLAREVRKNYRKVLVSKELADQNRRDLIKPEDQTRLRSLERELAADARAAAAAPASVPAAAAATGALRRVVTRECVRAACEKIYPYAAVRAMEAVLDDDVARERERQRAFRARLKTPGQAFGVAVAARGVRSVWGDDPGTLGVFVTRIDADDTLSTEGLYPMDGDNVDNVCSSFGLLTLAVGNAGRAGKAGAPLHKDLRGFGRGAIVTHLLQVQVDDMHSALMSSVQFSAVAVDLTTGDVIKTWRDGRIGYGLGDLEALVARDCHVQPPNVVTDDDVARWVSAVVVGGARPRGVLRVDEELCVIEKIEEGEELRENVRMGLVDAALTPVNVVWRSEWDAARLARAGAGGELVGTRFVLAGHGTTGHKGLRGAGAFVGRSPHYTNDDSLERLLRSHGAEVVNLANEPRSSAIFEKSGKITLCTNPRAIMVLSDGYNRPNSRMPPRWLQCFQTKGRAVKESYLRALADGGFDFDRVPLGPHLVYEPGTTNARAI